MHLGRAGRLRVRQPDIELVAEPERLDHPGADELAIIDLGDRLDQHCRDPMSGGRVILHDRAGRPFQGEIAHRLAQQRVIFPGGRRHRHRGAREAALMGEHLEQRDVALAVAGELRDVVGDAVVERKRAFFDQQPDRRRRDHLGVGVHQPERVRTRRNPRLEPRCAERAVERELAVTRDRDLGGRVAVLGDVPFDDPAQAVERVGPQAETRWIGGLENGGLRESDEVILVHDSTPKADRSCHDAWEGAAAPPPWQS